MVNPEMIEPIIISLLNQKKTEAEIRALPLFQDTPQEELDSIFNRLSITKKIRNRVMNYQHHKSFKIDDPTLQRVKNFIKYCGDRPFAKTHYFKGTPNARFSQFVRIAITKLLDDEGFE